MVWEEAPPPSQSYKSPTPASSVHLKIKIPVTVRRGISKRSREKIGDCKQSRDLTMKIFVGIKMPAGISQLANSAFSPCSSWRETFYGSKTFLAGRSEKRRLYLQARSYFLVWSLFFVNSLSCTGEQPRIVTFRAGLFEAGLR